MFRSFLAATAAVILSIPGVCQAAKVKVWHHYAPNNYDKAQFKQAVISNEGALRLAQQLKPLAGIDATHIWDVVEDKDGNLFLATGDEGKLFKVAPDGKTSVVYTSEDSQILSLALAPDGTLYAGTGPTGHILRIDPSGAAKVWCETEQAYVWSLAFDARTQTLYAGTGPKGRIYRINAEGKASVFYTTRQEHILCLGLGADGTLYAGTDKSGLVYRIDAHGKGFVLYSAAQAEIRSLLVTDDGLYVGTSSPTRSRSGGSSSTSTGGSDTVAVLDDKKPEQTRVSEGAAASTTSTSGSDSKETPKSSAAPAPAPPAAGENSLYRIATDGTVREIFREKALILCQLRQQGHVFVGTGMQGQLFKIDETTKERSEIARLDHGQILCMARRHDGSIVLGTGDPGKLYVLQDKYATHGTIVSEVLDAKIISKWGSLRWRSDTPAGTAVTVAVRSGNIAEPDETWSDWSVEQTDAQQGTITAPTARFIQYRLTLSTSNAAVTPVVHNITLRYMTTNQAPELTGIDVPDLDNGNQENPKKLKFKWTATDPNEDELTYNLYIRKDGWKQWVLLEEGLEKKEYEWDTTTSPSGTYQMKIVASDRKDNPPEDAQTGERISEPFVVSHIPPVVTLKVVGMDGDQAILEATATDPLVRLTGASFSVNGKKWVNVFPTDGLFDSKTESFKFKTEVLKPGTYVVVLRVRDAAANTGSGDVVFTVQPRTGEK